MADLKKVGLIGWPAKYSVSPAMHNAAFKDLGLDDWSYEVIATPPEELKSCVQTLAERGYVGANVTVPHKQTIIPLLDSVVLSARGANAVNTLLLEDGRIEGHNTDVVGIRADLEANGIKLKGLKVLVLGAGGAALAAVLALANAGSHVTIVNRHSQRAWDLHRSMRQGVRGQFSVDVEELSALGKIAPNTDLILNCTPLGMSPMHPDESPWPEDVPVPAGIIVYDMVYRPEVTRFMQQARDAGSTAIGGLGMLIQQGAASFQLWTGQEPSIDVMTQAARDALHNTQEKS
jgi:shikimate dehydrogenase